MSGEANAPSSYALMSTFVSPKQTEAECGKNVKKYYQWLALPERDPGIAYNAGPTVEAGQTACAQSVVLPTKTVLMSPGAEPHQDAIVGWTSPITGTVTASGSVQCTDAKVEGIVWELDQGSNVLIGPSKKTNETLTSFGPKTISVTSGESLYLEIGPGPHGGADDTTAVTLHITS